MTTQLRYVYAVLLLVLTSMPAAADPSVEVCNSGVVTELNQSLRDEAISLKAFLESRKQNRLTGRDRVEACSRWSVMGSFAQSMTRRFANSTSQEGAATLIERLSSELNGNNECWTEASPPVTHMLEGVRIVISRTGRLGALLAHATE